MGTTVANPWIMRCYGPGCAWGATHDDDPELRLDAAHQHRRMNPGHQVLMVIWGSKHDGPLQTIAVVGQGDDVKAAVPAPPAPSPEDPPEAEAVDVADGKEAAA